MIEPVGSETDVTEANAVPCPDVKDSVAFQLGYSVPEVQAIFVKSMRGNLFHVWTVVPEHDRRLYRSIYAKEKEIIKQFDGIDFDFNVAPSYGRDPRTLISDAGIELAFLRE